MRALKSLADLSAKLTASPTKGLFLKRKLPEIGLFVVPGPFRLAACYFRRWSDCSLCNGNGAASAAVAGSHQPPFFRAGDAVSAAEVDAALLPKVHRIASRL